jgi:hypothetical protein
VAKLVSWADQVDRSRKTDRITATVHTTQPALPPGCEPPFSRLTKLQSPVSGRCLT